MDEMKITEETIQYVAELAKLNVSEIEKEKIASDMAGILEYMKRMDEVDTEGVEPMSHVLPIVNRFREDIVSNGENRDEILQNATSKKDGSFMVPKTVD